MSPLIWLSSVSLLAATLWVYTSLPQRPPDPLIAQHTTAAHRSPEASLPSLVVPCITSHRRMIPTTAIHSFSYPLIYLAVDLDSLEAGRLDLGSRGFKYCGKPWGSMLGIQPGSYLDQSTTTRTIKERLVEMMEVAGVPKGDVGRVWMVTMPSYLGKSGINPLTTYFVYRRGTLDLLGMVLEVHNTFEERHVYVLRTGVDEEDESKLTAGHHHAWIFPRTFHVSPFNNRAGYYRLDVQDPFHADPSLLDTTKAAARFPKFKVTLNLLTQSHAPKLYAVLLNHPTQPPGLITLRTIINAVILRQPWSLLLTTPRILAQAWTLHYRKHLVVYPRPEPFHSATPLSDSDSESEETLVDDEAGLAQGWNPVERDLMRIGRAIGWQAVGSTERYAGRLVQSWLEGRCKEVGISLTFVFTNRERGEVLVDAGKSALLLRITTRHPFFYTHLLSSETPRHFLMTAHADHHTHVSSPELFERVFAPRESSRFVTWDQRLAMDIRRKHLLFLLGFSTNSPDPRILQIPPEHFIHHRPPTTHPLSIWQRLMILRIIAAAYHTDIFEEWIMWRAGARFVRGQEPWGVWARVVDGCWRTETGTRDVSGKGMETVTGMTPEEEEMDRVWGSIVVKEG